MAKKPGAATRSAKGKSGAGEARADSGQVGKAKVPEAGATADGPAARLPLFYKSPRPLEAARDAKMALRENATAAFAAEANAIPLNVVEFAAAARHYPIVFAASPPHLPVAICGIRPGTNVYVSAEGAWERGLYVPAYVRRYPFILMENREQEQFILCADEESGLLVEGDERRLFDAEGKPSELTNRAVDFCRAFHANHIATQQLVSALAEQDLLSDNTTEIRLPDDRQIKMQGYKVVDREKFDALSDDVFLDWRKRGWLPAIYSHLVALSNWPQLLQRAAARGGASASAD